MKKQPFVLSVASGKGGVGKTLTVINLAVSFAQNGYKVLILDGDLGMSNVDVVLGLKPQYNIRDVLDGTQLLKDIILKGPFGIEVIPTGSGITSLQSLGSISREILFDQLKNLDAVYDVLLIDTGAGINTNVLHLNSIADRALIVTTPEPHALTDAYAVIKVLSEEKGVKSFDLIVNMARSADEAMRVQRALQACLQQFIGAKLNYLGFVPFDEVMARKVLSRKVGSLEAKSCLAAQAWTKVSREYFNDLNETKFRARRKSFWAEL